MMRTLAVCIATYRRPDLLRRLLDSLARVEPPNDVDVTFRVVDNDHEQSAQTAISQFAARVGRDRVTGCVEPTQNIALARNVALNLGPADLIAFVDDDEVVPPDWLKQLTLTLDLRDVDAVTAPVEGRLAPNAPAWITRTRWFDKEVGEEGDSLCWREMRTSNTLVRGHWFFEHSHRFDPTFGRSGSSDTDLFLRLEQAGATFAASADARVWEDVEPHRATIGWLWRRHVRNGLTFQRLSARTESRRHPGIQAVARLARAAGRALFGLPELLTRGRPEGCLEGLWSLALAYGGLLGWLQPSRAETFVEYGERPTVAGSNHAPPRNASPVPRHVKRRHLARR